MRVFGQRARIPPTMRATSSTAPALPSMFEGLSRQQMAAAEHVQEKIAVAVVIAVEEPAFLMAVQRVVGGVEVENDLLGHPCMRLEEEVDEQGLDRRRVMVDFVIARGERTGEFEPLSTCRRAATSVRYPG